MVDEEKIINEVLKEVKKRWSGETQIGFSELALKEAIDRAYKLGNKLQHF